MTGGHGPGQEAGRIDEPGAGGWDPLSRESTCYPGQEDAQRTEFSVQQCVSRWHGGKWDILAGAILREDGARFNDIYRLLLHAARAEGIDRDRLPHFLDLEDGGEFALLGQEELGTSVFENALRDQIIRSASNSDLPEQDTERIILAAARVGQHVFALNVLTNCGRRCVFCGLNPSPGVSRRMLLAGHIKPWKDSSATERLDSRNGLAGCPSHGVAFDTGMTDYVQFAQTCQNAANAIGHFDRASFLINGTPRSWTDQTDGPALQTLAILQLYAQLDAQTQATASTVIAANLNFLQNAYQGQTYNLWEEEYGASFFARSVQLQCFQAIRANTAGIEVPAWLSTAIPWLQNALASHWNGQYYQSMLPVPSDYRASYDPNIDIVMAAIYGAIPVTDTKLLATAAQLRSQWAHPGSTYFYPVNGADQQRGIGPLIGRYPGDVYDGDTDTQPGDHPWAVSTANFAELYYRLAQKIIFGGTVPSDSLSAGFFTQVGVDASTTPAAAAAALQAVGDQMLQAVIFHSDNLELSEQFDATTGYEKSVSNLSWSYASFLSAVRARTAS